MINIIDNSTPLEWSALWKAMRASPNKFHRTTAEMYHEMLGAVPPAAYRSGAFLCGEADHHNNEGRAVYAGFFKRPDGIFARYLTRAEFFNE